MNAFYPTKYPIAILIIACLFLSLCACQGLPSQSPPKKPFLVDMQGNNEIALLKQTYANIRRFCGNQEPIILAQSLSRDGATVWLPQADNADPNGNLFLVQNHRFLVTPTPNTHAKMVRYRASLRCRR